VEKRRLRELGKITRKEIEDAEVKAGITRKSGS
jgi:hypothetical protein